MKSTLLLFLPLSFAILALFSAGRCKENRLTDPGNNKDSLVRKTDNYIQYVNGIAAHGSRFMSTYIKISGHKKYSPSPGFGYWPDSIEQTVNVIKYNSEPVEYTETPLNVPGGTNLEYDNYYYKGKLMAYRVFEVVNNSGCTDGTLTNTMTAYYDSTGGFIKTSHALFGSNNEPIDTVRCAAALNDFSHLYKSYSETPLVKDGIEAKAK